MVRFVWLGLGIGAKFSSCDLTQPESLTGYALHAIQRLTEAYRLQLHA